MNQIKDERASIEANSALSEQEKKDQLHELRIKKKESFKSILNAEQLEKMKEMRRNKAGYNR